MWTYRDPVARQVLFLHNDPSAPAALLGNVFAESGFDITTFDVVGAEHAGDPAIEVSLPDPARFDVIVPLGSRWAVYDERLPWIGAEIDMVRRGLDAGVGVLGVCFGGQLLARALGGTVVRSSAPEIGWCDIRSADPEAVPPGPWFQWHFDRFTVTAESTVIADNDCATQAFVHGRATGLQFHPEVDEQLVQRWIDEDTGGDIAGLGVDADELRARTAAEVPDAARRLRLLVRSFLDRCEDDSLHGAHRLR